MKTNESFFNLTQSAPELQLLKESLDRLYEIFSMYGKPSILTCLDYCATDEEQAIFDVNQLRGFPPEFILKLEFYDKTWQSWGTKEEVKYFLPRVLECITLCFIELGYPYYINMSILNKLSDKNQWSLSELQAIKDFATHMFKYYLIYGNFNTIDEAIDLIISCGLEPIKILEMIKHSVGKEKAIRAIFEQWIEIESNGINYYRNVEGKKGDILARIMDDNELLLNMEFVFDELWYNLLLKGFKNPFDPEKWQLLAVFAERRRVVDEYIMGKKLSYFSCPGCGFPTLSKRAEYEICTICGWEDEGQDDPDADEMRGGPNHISLTDNRLNIERTLRKVAEECNGVLVLSPEEMLLLLKKREAIIEEAYSKISRNVNMNDPILDEIKQIRLSSLGILINRNK